MSALNVNGALPPPLLSTLQINRETPVFSREFLHQLLGKQVEVKVVELLGGGKFLVDLDGQQLVAQSRDSLPVGSVHRAQVIGISPAITLRLLSEGSTDLFPSLREAASWIMSQPNAFASRLAELQHLLPQFSSPMLSGLEQVLQLFSGTDFFVGQEGMLPSLLEHMGLLLEARLATTGDSRQLVSAMLKGLSGHNLKVALLQAIAWAATQPAGDKLGQLQTVLQELLSLVELNQLYNNPGLRQDGGLVFIVPFLVGETELDVWLKLQRQPSSQTAAENDSLFTVTFFLDFPGFGQTCSRIVMLGSQTVVTVQVAGGRQRELLEEQVPAVEQQLAARLGHQVAIRIDQVMDIELTAFRQQYFLDDLPNLINARV
ncbi:MAG: hypothetical protein JXO49_08285 [Deltaproteobacteria bacterium]|nr:hypothetical protein [Candidatus Anaeroferrophillus wilburensis]MBN2889324.1 hypothetical protein [Deltaproteobacteria bacterium]